MAIAEVSLGYTVSARTRLEVAIGGTSTTRPSCRRVTPPPCATETYRLGLAEGPGGPVGLAPRGSLSHLTRDGDVTLLLPDDGLVTAPRHDDLWQAGADLGYTFASRLRVGVAAVYANRSSTLAYFGVRGLVMGATVVYSGTPTITLRP